MPPEPYPQFKRCQSMPSPAPVFWRKPSTIRVIDATSQRKSEPAIFVTDKRSQSKAGSRYALSCTPAPVDFGGGGGAVTVFGRCCRIRCGDWVAVPGMLRDFGGDVRSVPVLGWWCRPRHKAWGVCRRSRLPTPGVRCGARPLCLRLRFLCAPAANCCARLANVWQARRCRLVGRGLCKIGCAARPATAQWRP